MSFLNCFLAWSTVFTKSDNNEIFILLKSELAFHGGVTQNNIFNFLVLEYPLLLIKKGNKYSFLYFVNCGSIMVLCYLDLDLYNLLLLSQFVTSQCEVLS